MLSRLFIKIEKSNDSDLAFKTEFLNLSNAITDLIESFEKTNTNFRFSTFDARLYWDFDYRIPIATAITAGSIIGLEAAILAAATAGAVSNLIPKVEVSIASGRLQPTGNPLAYCYLISRDFGNDHALNSLSSKSFIKEELDLASDVDIIEKKQRRFKQKKKKEEYKLKKFTEEWIITFGEKKCDVVLEKNSNGVTRFLNTAMIFPNYDQASEYLSNNYNAISNIKKNPLVKKLQRKF